MLPDYLAKALHKIAKNSHFTDYSLGIENASSHGNNFAGVVLAVTVNGVRVQNGRHVPDKLHLVCKTPATDEKLRQSFQAEMVFDRELYIYANVLPAFVAFQREKGLGEAELFRSFPKVYACEAGIEPGTYLLIMEDLRVRNYRMWPKEKMVPLEHGLLVMKELGRFHAISFAMKDQRPDQFAEFKQLSDIYGAVLRGRLEPFFDISVNKSASVLQNPDHRRIMENFDFRRMMEHCFSWDACDKFGVVTHGDTWSNNYMFQHGAKNVSREILLRATCRGKSQNVAISARGI